MSRLANEKPICRQAPGSSHCGAVSLRWANDGDLWEFPAQERAGLRHDEVSLEVFAARGCIEIGEEQTIGWISQRSEGIVDGVSRLIVPCLEVGRLRGPDTEQDS